MNLTALRYFLALAETASFTRAAARLNVTQPTLSTAIARLEQQLGARLFHRAHTGVALTPAGQKLIPRAHVMLSEWRTAQTELAVATPRRRLRVGLLATLPSEAALGFAGRLRGLADGFDIELQDGSPSDLAGRLQSGANDLALTRLDGLPSELPAYPLLREAFRLGVSAGNLLAGRDRCSVRDLTEIPFLVRSRCEAHDQAQAVFAENDVRPAVLLRSGNEELIAALVAADHGACFLPESLMRPGMALVSIDELPFTRRLGLVWRPGLDDTIVELAREAAQAIRWRPRPNATGLTFAH